MIHRRPAKADKTQLRALYHRYNELRRHVSQLESEPSRAPTLGLKRRSLSSTLSTLVETEPRPTEDLAQTETTGVSVTQGPIEPATFDGNVTAPMGDRSGVDAAPAEKRKVSVDEADGPVTVETLKQEKLQLQRLLFKYQTKFQDEHGRAPRSGEDRAPYAREYRRYKVGGGEYSWGRGMLALLCLGKTVIPLLILSPTPHRN